MEQIKVEKTASRGIVIAAVYKYQELYLIPENIAITDEQAEKELIRFYQAQEEVKEELRLMSVEHEVFKAHMEIAGDITLQERVTDRISKQHKNAEQALVETVEELAAVFACMEDVYMKERAADVRDVGKRVLAVLKGVKLPDLGVIKTPVVVVAEDLYPSDTFKMNSAFIRGIITQEGGITSHVSIMARNLNIPMLVGVSGIMDKLNDGDMVCMDAKEGIIVCKPDSSVISIYEEKEKAYIAECKRLIKLRKHPVVTKNGKRVLLCANVGNIEEIEHVLEMNVDGIGLFRSEFLYMENDHFPTEEEQYTIYRQAVQLCPNEMTIRTLDIGGDKKLSYFAFDREENPFLGWRAIRISLDKKDMFKEQLRAILRASTFGHIRIMFPMIISIEEFKEAKQIVEECKQELKDMDISYDDNIALGMMMETPASVLLAEEFAREADFFSIGTNDLTQYILAVDRGNKKIAVKYDYFHPAVLKAIQTIIEAGHSAGIKVGMCGEMAGDQKAVPLLLEMGLDEFSVSIGSIDYVREQILNL